MKKSAQVVMLPTNEKATMALSGNKLSLKTKSDEEIKEKDSWSREEVVKLLQKLAENIDDNYRPYTRDNNIGFDMVNNDGKWIEENL